MRPESVGWLADEVLGYHRGPPMIDAQHRIDATGLLCPEPLMIVRNQVREMAPGEVLHVVATDPSTRRDFTNFCRFMGHELLEERESGGRFEFWIRKGV